MVVHNLDFSTLVPKRDTFTDTDGKVHEFRAVGDFGALDLATMKRLQRDMPKSLNDLSNNLDDEEPARRFERLTNESLKLILPSLADERIAAISMGQKAQITKWWQERNTPQNGALPVGEVVAGLTG